MAMAHLRSFIEELEPLYKTIKGVDPACFENIVIDAYSMEVLHKGKQGQRYAVVGYLVGDKIYLHFRPGFESTTTPEEKERLQKEWGQIVVAKPGQTGIVHEETMAHVKKLYPSYATDPQLVLAPRIGLSVIKCENGEWEWLNRSAQNYPTWVRNRLALACYAIRPNSILRRDQYTQSHHLERSIAKKAFASLAQKATFLINGPKEEEKEAKGAETDKIFYGETTNFEIEDDWEALRSCATREEKLARIQSRLLDNIYYIAAFEPNPHVPRKAADHEYLKTLQYIFTVAKDYHIPLDLNSPKIPKSMALLCAAAGNGYLDICKELMVNGAILSARNAAGSTALKCAAEKGHWETAVFLYENTRVEEKKEAQEELLLCAKSLAESILSPTQTSMDHTAAQTLLEKINNMEAYWREHFSGSSAVPAIDWNKAYGGAMTPLEKSIVLEQMDLFSFFYKKERDPLKKLLAVEALIDKAVEKNSIRKIESLLKSFLEEKSEEKKEEGPAATSLRTAVFKKAAIIRMLNEAAIDDAEIIKEAVKRDPTWTTHMIHALGLARENRLDIEPLRKELLADPLKITSIIKGVKRLEEEKMREQGDVYRAVIAMPTQVEKIIANLKLFALKGIESFIFRRTALNHPDSVDRLIKMWELLKLARLEKSSVVQGAIANKLDEGELVVTAFATLREAKDVYPEHNVLTSAVLKHPEKVDLLIATFRELLASEFKDMPYICETVLAHPESAKLVFLICRNSLAQLEINVFNEYSEAREILTDLLKTDPGKLSDAFAEIMKNILVLKSAGVNIYSANASFVIFKQPALIPHVIRAHEELKKEELDDVFTLRSEVIRFPEKATALIKAYRLLLKENLIYEFDVVAEAIKNPDGASATIAAFQLLRAAKMHNKVLLRQQVIAHPEQASTLIEAEASRTLAELEKTKLFYAYFIKSIRCEAVEAFALAEKKLAGTTRATAEELVVLKDVIMDAVNQSLAQLRASYFKSKSDSFKEAIFNVYIALDLTPLDHTLTKRLDRDSLNAAIENHARLAPHLAHRVH